MVDNAVVSWVVENTFQNYMNRAVPLCPVCNDWQMDGLQSSCSLAVRRPRGFLLIMFLNSQNRGPRQLFGPAQVCGPCTQIRGQWHLMPSLVHSSGAACDIRGVGARTCASAGGERGGARVRCWQAKLTESFGGLPPAQAHVTSLRGPDEAGWSATRVSGHDTA